MSGFWTTLYVCRGVNLNEKVGGLPFSLLSPSSPLPFLLYPLLPLPLEVGPHIAARCLGECLSSPAGPGGARPPNAFWCIFGFLTVFLCRFYDEKTRHTTILRHLKWEGSLLIPPYTLFFPPLPSSPSPPLPFPLLPSLLPSPPIPSLPSPKKQLGSLGVRCDTDIVDTHQCVQHASISEKWGSSKAERALRYWKVGEPEPGRLMGVYAYVCMMFWFISISQAINPEIFNVQ